ncbi:MAG: UDP-N-acetylmuramate dehydrogenase [Eudoraea sp.]|nr:UDP-N-acetylmuramate dehydrogenase [Eudoraea sp.]
MIIQENVSLKPYNTFGIEVRARYFKEINNLAELKSALELKGYPEIFVLSGGSNLLLTADLDRLVLYLNLKGKEIVQEDDSEIVLRIMAGENWHDLVLWTLERNYGGLENLALIPGNTGTAPIQNIGAYGVEIKDVLVRCHAMHVPSREIHTFSNEACNFGYRDSFFKREGKGLYIITAVDLRLSKKEHQTNVHYAPLKAELAERGISEPGIKDIANAVIAIRSRKLPDPKELGNSGSFFKNPVIEDSKYKELIIKFPDLPSYAMAEGRYKIPAAWLIDHCEFKGKRFGDAGVHENQALVLVNHGNASGKELLDLARKIQAEVVSIFGIELMPEVNIIG